MTPTKDQAAFLDWIEGVPEYLALQLRILSAFARAQGKALPLPPGPTTVLEYPGIGPLTTGVITPEQLDALANHMGEAVVKEKAIAFVRGLITGVMLAAG